jgi:hypothetical protein
MAVGGPLEDVEHAVGVRDQAGGEELLHHWLRLGAGLGPVVLFDRQHVVRGGIAGLEGGVEVGEVGARLLGRLVVELDFDAVDGLDVLLEAADEGVVGGVGPVADRDLAFALDLGPDLVERQLPIQDRDHHGAASSGRGVLGGGALCQAGEGGSRQPERGAALEISRRDQRWAASSAANRDRRRSCSTISSLLLVLGAIRHVSSLPQFRARLRVAARGVP